MRKPGIILLRGEPEACTACRDALNLLGLQCEIWWVPDASAALMAAVTGDHEGEVWTCTQEKACARITGAHGFAQVPWQAATCLRTAQEAGWELAARRYMGDRSW